MPCASITKQGLFRVIRLIQGLKIGQFTGQDVVYLLFPDYIPDQKCSFLENDKTFLLFSNFCFDKQK